MVAFVFVFEAEASEEPSEACAGEAHVAPVEAWRLKEYLGLYVLPVSGLIPRWPCAPVFSWRVGL